MQTKTVSAVDALSLANRQDDHFFDRKAAAIKGAKLQKVAVAFANADGGEAYVGITDEKDEPDPDQRWNGAANIEDYNQQIQALMEVQPALPMELSFLKAEGKQTYVLRIQIEKCQSIHKTSDGAVYERKGAQSLPITDPSRITSLSFAKGAGSYEDYSVESAVAEDIVDAPSLAAFLADYSPTSDPLEQSLNKNLVDRKTFKPKVAGLISFATEPSSVVPKKCSVRIVRYETKEDDPDRDHLGPIEPVEGPLYDLIHKTVDRITAIMSTIRV